MKKTIHIITIVLILLISFSVNSQVYAKKGSTDLGLGDLEKYKGTTVNNDNEFVKEANNFISVIRHVGMVVSVAILMIMGIKYMVGSIEEKSEYKKEMIPYLVGAFMVF